MTEFNPPKPSTPQPLPPLTPEDMKTGRNLTAVSNDTLQLQADVANVMEGRVPIESFDKDYQQRIQNYYRFHPIMPDTKAAAGSIKPTARSDKM